MEATLDESTRTSLLLAVRDAGDGRAWSAFAARYGGLVRSWCRRRGLQAADAEDVAQAVLAALFRAMPTFDYDAARGFRGYVYRAFERACADLQRRGARVPGGRGAGGEEAQAALAAADPEGGEPEAEALSRYLERDRLVAQACARARARSRETTWRAFWLVAVEGWESAAVASELGLTLDAVYAAVCRGRRRLREELERLGLGPGTGPTDGGG
jgi:RNA polymerase sigma-70 factor (ECF subfamily)